MRLPLHSILRRPDRRSVDEIRRDLDDEFAFHLAAERERLVAAGDDDARAEDAARRRFGDVDGIRSQCLRIALEERIMLQRLHLALTIVLVIGLVVLSAALVASVRAQAEQRNVALVEAQVAMSERERAEQVTAFLASVIAEVDPAGESSPGVDGILEHAEARIGAIEDEDLAERLRETIRQVREHAAEGK